MTKAIRNSFICIILIVVCGNVRAQLTLSTQLRTRAEFRDGQGSPLVNGAKPAFFISQRSRLSALFVSPRIRTNVTLQDVRVWGQDVSTINRTTAQELNGILLHEAWMDVLLKDSTGIKSTLNLKLGRQELIYDDQRLIGNLDWLQQARRHDAAVLRYETSAFSLHAGFAYNQNRENSSGTLYNHTPPGNYAATTNGGAMYKSMQFIYAAKRVNKGTLSYLFFADQFNKFNTDSIDNAAVKTYTNGTWNRVTTGFYFDKVFGRWNTTASTYYQFGRNFTGDKKSAWLLSALAMYQSPKAAIGAGTDYTSGSSEGKSNHTFDPLYGTPHKFWGNMDYFYAGNGFGQGGLLDNFLRLRCVLSKKLTATTEAHRFSSAVQFETAEKRVLGHELDLVLVYKASSDISVEGGFSHFFGTELLTSPQVKNVANARSDANWAYLMVNIKPQFLFKQ